MSLWLNVFYKSTTLMMQCLDLNQTSISHCRSFACVHLHPSCSKWAVDANTLWLALISCFNPELNCLSFTRWSEGCSHTHSSVIAHWSSVHSRSVCVHDDLSLVVSKTTVSCVKRWEVSRCCWLYLNLWKWASAFKTREVRLRADCE